MDAPQTDHTEKATLGKRIAEIANFVGGKKKLAKLAGISEAHLYRYISGKSQPTIGPLMEMSKAAGVTLDWLATGRHTSSQGYLAQSGGGSGQLIQEAVAGYPEIDASMILTALKLIEQHSQDNSYTLRIGVVHDLVLAICKQHVDRMRAHGGTLRNNDIEISQFKELLRLAQ
uniref:Putative Transcriptional regulator [similar to part of Mmc1_2302] n=1 Tax=Magnetococcus massalia (strain MO-1) TaxID=451514 RepID=A0A1S7LL11_MAGMO|nr:putative Transcriptional regulator [similar to part of Mmc1_2302] [Candidatus Magnetococcus massalia]